ncbi:MarR family winged helix-turn-helix transcriptional regulator [Actinomadura rudentiformis]|uniref:Winged helix-turn-helix transcriptional regulator n=1 Tax=Actinomadura rudentiformis TaxID=359158 RepID=A0A6H9Z255_9ACTN|nr:MarR family winged helix-turn-helix transcriptional regulator [Actinomadura rudentiformis]KAB2348628.1 winged helix-turn-helix transcriptional regulator [Actinomadura rudentiformis]
MEPGEVAAHRIRVLGGLRIFGANYTEFTRRFALWLGLHSTDAAALAEILYAEDKGEPLTPSRLSARVSLSSGATTTLLNRLERAGHIVRTREHTDRRVVTLRSSPQIQGPAQEFFAPLARHMDALLAHYPPELLEQFETFLDRLNSTMEGVLTEDEQPPDR